MTPHGRQPGAPAPQQGWFSRNWKWLVGCGCLLALLCCGAFSVLAYAMKDAGVDAFNVAQKSDQPLVKVTETDGARVDCGAPGPGGVDCDVKRTSGGGALEACWDLDITCANGAVMRGHACGTLGAGEAATTVNMPVSAFSNQDACDAPARGAVQNLVVQTVH
jgi:hypothetical protein